MRSRRVPVEGVVLQMKAMGIDNVETFPFPEPPPQQTIASAQHALRRREKPVFDTTRRGGHSCWL
eukprot:6185489-Pleurochrysis_carterae.AAC.1